MRQTLLVLAFIAWGTVALADFTGKVVAVADGDTIAGAAKLSVSDKPLNVR